MLLFVSDDEPKDATTASRTRHNALLRRGDAPLSIKRRIATSWISRLLAKLATSKHSRRKRRGVPQLNPAPISSKASPCRKFSLDSAFGVSFLSARFLPE